MSGSKRIKNTGNIDCVVLRFWSVDFVCSMFLWPGAAKRFKVVPAFGKVSEFLRFLGMYEVWYFEVSVHKE